MKSKELDKKLTSERVNELLKEYKYLKKISENEYEFGSKYGTLFEIAELKNSKKPTNLYVIRGIENLHAIAIDALSEAVNGFRKYDVEKHKIDVLIGWGQEIANVDNSIIREEYIDYIVHNFMLKDFCEIEKYENLNNIVKRSSDLIIETSGLEYTNLEQVILNSDYSKLNDLVNFYNKAQSFIKEIKSYNNCIINDIDENDFDMAVSFNDYIVSKGIVYEPGHGILYKAIPYLDSVLLDYITSSFIEPLSPDELFNKCLEEGLSAEELLYGNSRDMFEYLVKTMCKIDQKDEDEDMKYTDEDFEEFVRNKSQLMGIQYKK